MATKTIKDGVLIYSAGLFRKKNVKIDLKDIEFIVPRKGLLLGHYVHIGDRNDFHKLRISEQLAHEAMRQAKEAGAPLVENYNNIIEFEQSAKAFQMGSLKSINKNTVWLKDDIVIYVPKRKILAKDDEPVYIPNNNVRFSSTNPHKILFGLLPRGHKTYFGTPTHQAVFYHPKVEQSQRLISHMKENGAMIGMKMDQEFKDSFWLGKLLKPLLFFRHETIGFNDEGVSYAYKKGKKSETIFMPYSGIKYASLEKGFLHSNYVEILGEQNIITKLQFSNKVISQIKVELSKRNVQEAMMLLTPTMWLGLVKKPFAKRSLAVTEETVCFTDKKTKDVQVYTFGQVSNMAWKKKYFFYLVGYLFFEGSGANFRKDQTDHTYGTFVMPRIWFTKKNKLKQAIDAKYNEKDFKKRCQIGSVKYF